MELPVIFRFLSIAFLMQLMPTYSAAQDNGGWPRIDETQISKRFHKEDYAFELKLPIFAKEGGEQIYNLFCIGGKDHYLDNLSDTTGLNLVGPLSCQLAVGTGSNGHSLLSEDSSPVWHSRGQFHYNQLSGSCAIYPEYGRVRNFKLRGMLLTLIIADVQETNTKVDNFLLTIKVQNDPTALTAKAERSGYLHPQLSAEGIRDCDTILEGKRPLMCRNSETLSLEECPEGWEYEKYSWESEAQ